MTSAAKIEANRRNAQHSTGPRTPEGKAAASRNAVTHGLFCQQVVLSADDAEQFDAFAREMAEQFQPAGPYERLLVDRFVSQAWRIRRVLWMENVALESELEDAEMEAELMRDPLGDGRGADDPEARRAVSAAMGRQLLRGLLEGGTMDKLRRYERGLDRSLRETQADLERAQETRRRRENDGDRGLGTGDREGSNGDRGMGQRGSGAHLRARPFGGEAKGSPRRWRPGAGPRTPLCPEERELFARYQQALRNHIRQLDQAEAAILAEEGPEALAQAVSEGIRLAKDDSAPTDALSFPQEDEATLSPAEEEARPLATGEEEMCKTNPPTPGDQESGTGGSDAAGPGKSGSQGRVCETDPPAARAPAPAARDGVLATDGVPTTDDAPARRCAPPTGVAPVQCLETT